MSLEIFGMAGLPPGSVRGQVAGEGEEKALGLRSFCFVPFEIG